MKADLVGVWIWKFGFSFSPCMLVDFIVLDVEDVERVVPSLPTTVLIFLYLGTYFVDKVHLTSANCHLPYDSDRHII